MTAMAMGKRKRPQKKARRGKKPLRKTKCSQASVPKVDKKSPMDEHFTKRSLSKICNEIEGSNEPINQQKKQFQQNKKKLCFALKEHDELEAAKTHLFNLRQMKACTEKMLLKYQQQVKCINEEIEEKHKKLQQLLARHTREEVEKCSCKETKNPVPNCQPKPVTTAKKCEWRPLPRKNCSPEVKFAWKNMHMMLRNIETQKARAKLANMMQKKQATKECLRKDKKLLEGVKGYIERLQRKRRHLAKRLRKRAMKASAEPVPQPTKMLPPICIRNEGEADQEIRKNEENHQDEESDKEHIQDRDEESDKEENRDRDEESDREQNQDQDEGYKQNVHNMISNTKAEITCERETPEKVNSCMSITERDKLKSTKRERSGRKTRKRKTEYQKAKTRRKSTRRRQKTLERKDDARRSQNRRDGRHKTRKKRKREISSEGEHEKQYKRKKIEDKCKKYYSKRKVTPKRKYGSHKKRKGKGDKVKTDKNYSKRRREELTMENAPYKEIHELFFAPNERKRLQDEDRRKNIFEEYSEFLDKREREGKWKVSVKKGRKLSESEEDGLEDCGVESEPEIATLHTTSDSRGSTIPSYSNSSSCRSNTSSHDTRETGRHTSEREHHQCL